MSDGLLLIISGPSGSGKGTVVNLMKKNKDVAVSISVTTRQKREGEIENSSYFYTTEERFREMVNNDELLEHATFAGHYYGTPRSYVEQKIGEGKTVILEIEVQGALQVKMNYPKSILIFLIPPTMKELSRRLISRNTDSEESIEERLRRCSEEIKFIDKYDYLVVNDSIYKAVSDINSIAYCERLRPSFSKGIIQSFKGERT